MCSNEKYLKRRPDFNVCKEEVLKKIESVWRKSSPPVINKKSMETKLKKLIKQYTLAKAKENGVQLLHLETLFDVSSCKCDIAEVVKKNGKVSCKCSLENRIPFEGEVKLSI